MSNVVFIDTETTSLRPDRRAWDIALIVRDEDGTETEHQWFVYGQDLDLGNADLMALKIGRFYDRHPQGIRFAGGYTLPPSELDVLLQVEELTRGAHLVGAVPNFDAEVLGTRMRAHGICPSWHYHLIDVETLAVGYLAAKGQTVRLPWRSDDLSMVLGVAPPVEEDRHTALGDTRWARDLYDAIASTPEGS